MRSKLYLILSIIFYASFGFAQSHETISYNNYDDESLFMLSRDALEANNYGEAYEYCLEYLGQRRKVSNEEYIKGCIRLGKLFESEYNDILAITFIEKGVKAIPKDQPQRQAVLLRKLGDLYLKIHDLDKAYECSFESLGLFEDVGDQNSSADLLNRLGNIYRENHKIHKALSYFRKAETIYQAIGDSVGLGNNYADIGQLYTEERMFSFANSFLKKSLLLIKNESKNRIWIGRINYYYGLVYFWKKDYDLAIGRFQEAVRYLSSHENSKELISAHATMGRIFTDKGKLKEASNAFHVAYILQDKQMNEQQISEQLKLKVQLEISKKDEQLKKMMIETEKESQQKRFFNVLTISILIILILLLLLALTLTHYRVRTSKQTSEILRHENELKMNENRRLIAENESAQATAKLNNLEKIKLQNDLKHKQQQLSTHSIHLLNKNNALINVQDKLKEYIRAKNRNIDDLHKIVREINEFINLDKDWDNFKLHFESVHEGFFRRLKELYPGLTQDELKLCAYLRINLSSKEISKILNINPTSVNKRRNRLRKKLDITPEINLVDFIMRI
ncbi:tetratricopeptide repeat protein [Halosquirtibacter xylanolyticus]|uniref:tetratricopeptide repeat protein n=1 Tax=Halosquirtibacter xylanolyticus TaxID=3374599 RepID=UPI003748404A|nr:tetratricopeptide repeat protein [Prolixibacteraceae bacterium]